MVDIVLLVGKFVLLALVYLFLFAAVRAGVGLVAHGGIKRKAGFAIKVVEGPKPLKGSSVPVFGPVVIGRASGSDIVIADGFVSSEHAHLSPSPDGIIVRDMGSTNGTVVNGELIDGSVSLTLGDEITLGDVRLKVVKS